MKRISMLATAALLMMAMLAVLAGTAAAHPHVASNPDPDQQLANDQNHPRFIDDGSGLHQSCEGVEELPGTGPAFYGIETAHHGPDAGDPGKDDGCYATQGAPQDNNPGIS